MSIGKVHVVLALALVAASCKAPTENKAWVVSTLAGGSNTGSLADGTGSEARFNNPTGVAVDSSGNVYVADNGNNRIRKVTAEGVVSTLAGGDTGSFADGAGSEARFNAPFGVAVDSRNDNVYVADTYNYRIRKVVTAEDGTVTVSTLAGGGNTGSFADGSGSEARFENPTGVAVDSSGNIYVADDSGNRIRKIVTAEDGAVTVSTLAGTGAAGSADTGPNTSAQFSGPYGVAVDSSGNVYVADSNNHRIRKVTENGIVSTLAGGGDTGSFADGTGSEARFNTPYGVAVDSSGNIYVADPLNHRIRKIVTAEDGTVTVSTLAGSGTEGHVDGTGIEAQFRNPTGVAVDSSGKIYVADYGNNRIRKIEYKVP